MLQIFYVTMSLRIVIPLAKLFASGIIKLVKKKHILSLAAIVLIAVAATLIFSFLKVDQQKPIGSRVFNIKKESSNSSVVAIKNATKSATPKPSLKPIPIPAQTGRSVRIPILTYHYIGNNPNPADKARDNLEVTPDKFEQQMEYLSKNGYQTVSFDTLYAALGGKSTLPAKSIILTFDDGYIDFYLNAFPILRRFGLHAISFIPTGLIGTSYYMSWGQIKEIDSSGLVSFQAHSVTHPNMTSLSDEQLKHQVIESKKTLESQLGKPVNTFAYPYGISDERVWKAVKNAGFIGSVGTWYGNTVSEGTILDMPRIKIPGSADINNFASRL